MSSPPIQDSPQPVELDFEDSPVGNSLPNLTPVPIDLCDDEVDNRQATVKRKSYSKVWDHFKKQKIGGLDKATCNYCKKHLSGASKHGTSHLREHVKICPHRNQPNVKQFLLNPIKEEGGNVSMGTYCFDQDKARKELGNMIILHEYPLSMVEHIGFRRFTHTIQPLFKHVSRNTIKKDILKIYDYEKSKIMQLLDNNKSRISITTDLWTSNQKKGFMVVTAHFIDSSWRLQSRVIRFIYVPCPHTAEMLSTTLMDCLLDWNLDRKLCTLTVDNCTTNDAMISYMLDKLSNQEMLLCGKFFHMRCCAHILNLIVKDGLDIISSSVEKIRDSVAFWSATPKRVEIFESCARQLNHFNGKKLKLDCKTRWNSTYLMLHTALVYKDVFPRLSQRISNYRCVPSEEDWVMAKEICERLEVFYDVTEIFSGTKYPTANLFFPNVCDIKLAIYEWLESTCAQIQLMASCMIEKFEKYWDVIHGMLAVATVLDPRYKMKLVEFYFPKIFEGTSSINEIENVRQICHNLIKEYKTQENGNVPTFSGSSTYNDSSIDTRKKSRMVGFDAFVSNTTNVDTAKTELDLFLEEPVLPRSNDFDILAWWKLNGLKYPTMQKLARDILAIPVSTVASESAFSTSGRFVSPHRNRLHPNTLEALMCAQDWLWADIHEKSSPSSYYGSCHRFSEEEVEGEDGCNESNIDIDSI